MARCPDCDLSCPDGALECQRCGATISMVCAQCGAGNPALARFCCGCGARIEAAVDSQGQSSLARPEWRQLTVLFCDVVGSTALGRKLDPEDFHRVIQQLHSQCGELVAKQHGYIAQYLGDGLLAYFGYPVANEDAPRRAVTAGLEIARRAGDIRLDGPDALSVRIGIHTGPVIVSNIGSKRHQESLALGETPNLAARLQEAAPAGGVVISPETKHLVEGYFDCEELGSFSLKGFSQPQLVYRVVAERSPRTRLEAASDKGLTPLVGRAAEVSVLKEAWAKLTSGEQAPILMLSGEPGIGKSRLIHELKQAVQATAASVLELRCSQRAQSSVLHPVLEYLQRQLGRREADDQDAVKQQLAAVLDQAQLSAQQAALIGGLLGFPIDPALAPAAPQLRDATLEAVSAWVVGPAAKVPRLVVIEDLHWADPSTLDLLASIFNVAPRRVLFVLSARPEFAPPWADRLSSVVLSRLDAEEMGDLVTRVAGNKRLPREVLERLASRSECIPLFLEEMTKAVIESGLVRETASEYVLDAPMRDSAIPATLSDSLMGRLDQLGHGKPVAQLAAVLGREFEYPLFEAVWRKIPAAPQISLVDALERLVGAQLLIREGEQVDARYQFRHSLIQEAAAQSLLRSARHDYHRYAAQAIIELFPARAELEPELVAHHFSRAEERSQAVDFWSKAGQRTLLGSAYAEATSHFKAGLEQLAQITPSVDRSRLEMGLRSSLGVTLIASSGFASKDVEDTYARAAELCHELGDEIPLRVLYGTWAVNLVRGDLTSTTRMLPGLERLAASASEAAPRLVAHASLSTWAFWRGEYARAMKHGVLAAELVDVAQPKEQHAALLRDHGFEGLLYSGVYLTWAQALTGDVDAARQTWRDVSERAEAIGDPYVSAGVYAFGAVIHHDLGDLEVAAELAAKLRELCQDRAFPFWHAVGLTVGGSCALEGGGEGAAAAIASIQQGLGILRAIGAKTPYPYHLKLLAEAHLATGAAADATQTLQEALGMMRTNLDRNFEPEVLRLLGEAMAAAGDSTAAHETLSAALDLCRSQGARLLELKVATTLAEVMEREGNSAPARDLLGPVVAAFPPIGQLSPLRKAAQVLARLG